MTAVTYELTTTSIVGAEVGMEVGNDVGLEVDIFHEKFFLWIGSHQQAQLAKFSPMSTYAHHAPGIP